jgi:hypothetical protein
LSNVFVFVFVIALFFATIPANPLRANPVPYPVIIMPEEYINANITVTGETGYAKVNTSYPFTNLGYPNVSMYYPLPLNSTNVGVKIDSNVTDWFYMNETYETVVGDLPVMNWTISPAPAQFVVSVDYDHPIIVEDGVYRYFYAMGTWQILSGAYEKLVSVFVTLSIHMDMLPTETLNLNVCQVKRDFSKGEWRWDVLPYTMIRVGDTFEVGAYVSSFLTPDLGDLVVSFERSLAGDVNLDGIVDIGDALLLSSCFGYRHRYPVDPRYPGWIYQADCKLDGVIDVFDAIILCNNFGKSTH